MIGNGGITHQNFYKLKTVEFRQIEKLADDSEDGEYSAFGYQDQSGQIGSFDEIIERIHKEGNFASLGPPTECRPMSAPEVKGRTRLSFPNNGQKTLHILKLSTESNLVFDPDKHPVQAAILNSYGPRELAMIPRLFSDCRFLYFDQDGDLEPRIPSDHRHQNEWMPDTQWACFAFNGLLAKRLKEEWKMEFAFHFHVIDRDKRITPYQEQRLAEISSGKKRDEDSIETRDPPFWPGHHGPPQIV